MRFYRIKCFMERTTSQIFLYSGLSLLLVAFIVKWLGAPLYCFWALLGMAIVLKVFFLITIFRIKGFKPGLWLYLIFAGVAMILVSLLFKSVFPMPDIRNMLFYGAISLKVIGLFLMVFENKFFKKNEQPAQT